MSNLSLYKSNKYNNPKLGIKSSFSNPHEGIASLALIYLVTGQQVVKPFSKLHGSLEIKQYLVDDISEFLRSNSILSDEELNSFSENFQSNILTEVQLEAQKVFFDVMLGVAKVGFLEHAASSSEREGGQRFYKVYSFTSLIDIFCDGIYEDKEACSVLAYWAAKLDVPDNLIAAKKKIARKIFFLLMQVPYKMVGANGDVYFNTLGLYEFLLSGKDFKFETGEKRGPLRILNTIVMNSLLPALINDSSSIKLNFTENSNQGFTEQEVEDLVKKSKEYLDVRNIGDFFTNESSEIEIQDDFIDESFVSENEIQEYSLSDYINFSGPHNIIYYGVPGSGKSFIIDNNLRRDSISSIRVVFHPDYLYSNFIGQILPSVTEDHQVTYTFNPGPFARALYNAIHNPSIKHALVIEEINRGNTSAIFGDIFQLLDRGEDGHSRYQIINPDLARFIYNDENREIFIPSNLYIYATMNSSDQNVFTLDTAFQRRWAMRMILNSIEDVPFADVCILDTSTSWKKFNKVINNLIMSSSSGISSTEDKRLGAYFVSKSEIQTLPGENFVFAEKVIKYLWDDAFKFNRSSLFKLSDSRSLEDVLQIFIQSRGNDRWLEIFVDSVSEELVS